MIHRPVPVLQWDRIHGVEQTLAIVREVGAETTDPGLVLQVCVRTRHRIQELLAGQSLDEAPLVAIQMHTIPRWGFGDWPAEASVGLGQAILRDALGYLLQGRSFVGRSKASALQWRDGCVAHCLLTGKRCCW